MQKLQFRAWVGNNMLQVTKLDLLLKGSSEEYAGYGEGYFLEGEQKGKHTRFKMKDAVFRQYTGLQDKHGKEIYEGDILQYDSPSPQHQYKHKVIYVDGGYAFDDMRNFVFCQRNLKYKRGYKVVGNIYENPELLEAEVDG